MSFRKIWRDRTLFHGNAGRQICTESR